MPSVVFCDLLARRRAAEQQHQVGMFGAADPDLLAVDDVAVALAPREGADAGRIGAAGRLGDAERLQAEFAAAIFGRYCAFCSALPCRSSAPIVYICAWHAAPLQPERWISSRIAVAAPSPSPDPPIFLGDQDREKAFAASDVRRTPSDRRARGRARASIRRENRGRAWRPRREFRHGRPASRSSVTHGSSPCRRLCAARRLAAPVLKGSRKLPPDAKRRYRLCSISA